MNDDQIDGYKAGYAEYRALTKHRLEKILKSEGDLKQQVESLVSEIKDETEKEQWDEVQKELPGITKEEYQDQLKIAFDEIVKKFYSEKGYLKPRLVKNGGAMENRTPDS